jgi:tetratricopeptide (TPR) repeat protein
MIFASRIAAVTLALSWTCASTPFAETGPPPQPPTDEATPRVETESDLPALDRAKDAFKQGAWEDALDAATTLLRAQPDNLDALYIVGASERQLKRLSSAEGHLRTLIGASPRFPFAHFQLGFVLFLEADDLAAEGQTELARVKYVESAREFGDELERAPTNGPSLSSRAVALARAGEFDESLRAHEAWIEAVPHKNAPFVSLAATYAVARRLGDAMQALDRLPDRSAKAVSDAARTVADVLVARHEWNDAVPFLETMVEGDPASPEARGLLTEGYARSGLASDAASSLKSFLGLDPSPDEAERVGEAIKASFGDGTRAPSRPGVEPPAALRIPSPRYPRGQDTGVQTTVRVLTRVREDGAVVDTVLVPNRIWREIRDEGFEAAAIDAVEHGKFDAGTTDGQRAALWLVVAVTFAGA